MSGKHKIRVRVYRLGKEIGIFESISAAGRALNINHAYITRALNDTLHIAKGYKFEKVHGRKPTKR